MPPRRAQRAAEPILDRGAPKPATGIRMTGRALLAARALRSSLCKPGDIIEPEPQGPNDASACRMRRNDRRRKPGGSRHRRTGLNEPFVPPEVYYRVPEYTEQPG